MEVSALAVDPTTNLPFVLLVPAGRGASETRQEDTPVVVSIGLGEASAIATELDGIEFERPATHQLMYTLLESAGARVQRVELQRVQGDHFRARIHLVLPGERPCVHEGRPSDALALALCSGAEIRVAAGVLGRRAADDHSECICVREPEATARPSRAMSPSFVDADLSEVGDEAFGKWKM